MKKHYNKTILFITTLFLFSFLLSGCQKKEVPLKLEAPFTEMTWDSTKDDIIAAEGDNYETYDSVYNGTTYTFPKTFNDKEGIVKYMFNDKDRLMCVAWTFSSSNLKELEGLYNKLNKKLVDDYGDSEYNADESKKTINNYGNTWYLDSGSIVLTAMTTDKNKALQLSYLHPDVSSKEK